MDRTTRLSLILATGGGLILAALPAPIAALGAAATAPALLATFTTPIDRSRIRWNDQAGYRVTIVYRGKSTAYAELPGSDVVIEARSVPDIGSAAILPRTIAPALVTISRSNCAGCHDFTAAGAGPSFAAIAVRYAHQPAAAALLATHIRDGSRGAWGIAAMPPHPDISPAEAREVADWVLGHGADASVRYAIGTEGSIRMVAPPRTGSRAGMVLTAFYTGPLSGADAARSAGPRSRIAVLGTAGD